MPEKILVVDDNNEICRAIEEILSPLGYQVISAQDGQRALQVALTTPVDLILLDLKLPDQCGIEVLVAIRQACINVPVIFMAGYGSVTMVAKAFKLGVIDYLSKPFTVNDVKQAVERALRNIRLERERSEMERNLLAAEAVRKTMVTLSHYLNNYLTSLNGSLIMLEEGLEPIPLDPTLLQYLNQGKISAQNIQKVLQALQQLTNVTYTYYSDKAQMVNIEEFLAQTLPTKM